MPALHSRIRDLIRGWLSPNPFDDFIFDFGHLILLIITTIHEFKRMPALHSRIRDLIRGWLSPNPFDDFIFDFGHLILLIITTVHEFKRTPALRAGASVNECPRSIREFVTLFSFHSAVYRRPSHTRDSNPIEDIVAIGYTVGTNRLTL